MAGVKNSCTICHRADVDTYHRAGQEDVHACASCINLNWPGQFAFGPDGIPVFRGWLDDFTRNITPQQMKMITALRWLQLPPSGHTTIN